MKSADSDDVISESKERQNTFQEKAYDLTGGVNSCRMQVDLPLATIVRVFAALLAGLAAYKLWPLLLLVFLALLLAVTIHPVVEWLESKKVKRWASLLLVITTLLAVLCFSIALVIPELLDQMGTLSNNFPAIRDEILGRFLPNSFVRQNLSRMFENPGWPEMGTWMGRLIFMGGVALGGVSEFVILLVIACYLMIDGNKIYEWMLAFFSPLNRAKIRISAEEISHVIFGYIAGQAITSILVMIYAYIVLGMLKVPAALPLSIVAGVFDILPILGFFLSTVPACLLALSVSSRTALIVLGLYLLYHVLENYLIVPKVYGKSLRLSTLTVLLGLLAGGLLAGIPGALAALPLVASYSVIERIWLKPFLGKGVSEKHELQKDMEFGEKL